jgi:hypothetical protein
LNVGRGVGQVSIDNPDESTWSPSDRMSRGRLSRVNYLSGSIDFNKGLMAITDDGTLDNIMASHGF